MTRPQNHAEFLSETLAETAHSLRDAPRPAPQPLPRRGIVMAAAVAATLLAGGASPARADWMQAAVGVVRVCLQSLNPSPILTCQMPLDGPAPGACQQ